MPTRSRAAFDALCFSLALLRLRIELRVLKVERQTNMQWTFAEPLLPATTPLKDPWLTLGSAKVV